MKTLGFFCAMLMVGCMYGADRYTLLHSELTQQFEQANRCDWTGPDWRVLRSFEDVYKGSVSDEPQHFDAMSVLSLILAQGIQKGTFLRKQDLFSVEERDDYGFILHPQEHPGFEKLQQLLDSKKIRE